MNIIDLAKQAGLKQHQEQAPGIDGVVGSWVDLEAFAELVASQEREACAKVCDDYDIKYDVNTCDTAEGIALEIRARGTT